MTCVIGKVYRLGCCYCQSGCQTSNACNFECLDFGKEHTKKLPKRKMKSIERATKGADCKPRDTILQGSLINISTSLVNLGT